MDRELSLLNGKYMFKFKKERGVINELSVWMRRFDLFFADSFFKQQRIQTLEDFDDFDCEKLQ